MPSEFVSVVLHNKSNDFLEPTTVSILFIVLSSQLIRYLTNWTSTLCTMMNLCNLIYLNLCKYKHYLYVICIYEICCNKFIFNSWLIRFGVFIRRVCSFLYVFLWLTLIAWPGCTNIIDDHVVVWPGCESVNDVNCWTDFIFDFVYWTSCWILVIYAGRRGLSFQVLLLLFVRTHQNNSKGYLDLVTHSERLQVIDWVDLSHSSTSVGAVSVSGIAGRVGAATPAPAAEAADDFFCSC